jgi:hypothetical protein
MLSLSSGGFGEIPILSSGMAVVAVLARSRMSALEVHERWRVS